MKINYIDWNPKEASLSLVKQANSIINEYAASDLTLTLRQLYYQFVARDIIENTERSYKNLGNLVTKARNAGLISWQAIEDRNRSHNTFWTREDDIGLIKELPYHIRFDQWARQDNYVEVWVEKEALGNVIQKACRPLLVPYMSCKGYLSASEAWRAGRRLKKQKESGKNITIIHLGDHDPSGIDMTRDNEERLRLYSETYNVNVKRIALNMDQIDSYSPPPNPTKLSDSRAKDYISKFGKESWELDALEPQVLIDLITDTVNPMIDWDVWNETSEEESEVEGRLHELGDNWELVSDFLKGLKE